MKIISTKKAPLAIGPYSQAISTGNMVFISGQLPLNPETMNMVGDDIISQTRQVIQNLKAVLVEAGLELKNVVKTTVYLANLSDFPTMNSEYEKQFDNHKPARATVEVSRLPKDALLEIDCIAIRE